MRTSCLTSRTAHATPHCSLRLARVVASVPAQPLQVVRRRRPWCGAALFSLIGRAPPESTPPNARTKTRANAVSDTVKRDVPPPSLRPLAPRQPAVHSVPSTALAAPPSPDPPPEAPPEPPLRPLRLPVRSLPLWPPGHGDCGSTVSVLSVSVSIHRVFNPPCRHPECLVLSQTARAAAHARCVTPRRARASACGDHGA